MPQGAGGLIEEEEGRGAWTDGCTRGRGRRRYRLRERMMVRTKQGGDSTPVIQSEVQQNDPLIMELQSGDYLSYLHGPMNQACFTYTQPAIKATCRLLSDSRASGKQHLSPYLRLLCATNRIVASYTAASAVVVKPIRASCVCAGVFVPIC